MPIDHSTRPTGGASAPIASVSAGHLAHTPAAMADGTDAALGARDMACPVCGHSMPDLKGGKASICAICGFKDSCCF